MNEILNKILEGIKKECTNATMLVGDTTIFYIDDNAVECPIEFLKIYGAGFMEYDSDSKCLTFMYDRCIIYLYTDNGMFSLEVQSKLDGEIAHSKFLDYNELKKWIDIVNEAFMVTYNIHTFDCIIPELAAHFKL